MKGINMETLLLGALIGWFAADRYSEWKGATATNELLNRIGLTHKP